MKGLLKFITCGSVDDGKSTLIGHILYDAKLLIVDDNAELLALLCEQLRGAGYVPLIILFFWTV
jgi:sulfate adenylyltransferase subunit 1 (EFTu-like GTPase family)